MQPSAIPKVRWGDIGRELQRDGRVCLKRYKKLIAARKKHKPGRKKSPIKSENLENGEMKEMKEKKERKERKRMSECKRLEPSNEVKVKTEDGPEQKEQTERDQPINNQPEE